MASGRFTPKGMDNFRPHWPSSHPSGSAKIVNQEWPRKPFVPQMTLYPYTKHTTMQILKEHNNLAIRGNRVKHAFTVGKTKPGLLSSHLKEGFSDFYLVNPRMHIQPVWILIAFLAMVMIIFR